jgi:DNA-binding transcriptional MerR regulator/quercetin dioxygenase-like cupin family protein
VSGATTWLETGDGAAESAGNLLRSIGEVSRLTGISRGMLRLWERERLINPKRTPGGHRLYSSDDLQRLRQIAHLRRVDRLNMAAIRRELGAAEGAAMPPGTNTPSELGQRLRALRTERQWSLTEVAEKSGLSVSFLSAVERGQSSISVASLFKLADAYGTTVPGLSPDYQSHHRSLLHPRERPRYVADRGLVVIEDLIASPGALEAQRIEIQPGGGSEEGYAHPGEEFVYVLAGQLTFWIDEREHYELQAGDSLYFRSTRLHRWRNDSDTPTTVLWINVPVVEPAPTGVPARGAARARRSSNGATE